MALPTSGPISMGDINVELGRSRTASISLNNAQNGLIVPLRTAALPKPTSNDQASISEWRGYQHSPPVDTIAPSAPTNVSAYFDMYDTVYITWDVSTDNVAIIEYDIYIYYHSQGGNEVITIPSNNLDETSPQYLIRYLPPGVYTFIIIARDSTGNVSLISNESNDVIVNDYNASQ